MGDTWVVDMRHYPPPDAPVDKRLEPAIRLRDYFGLIVSASTLAPGDRIVSTALPCRRKPERRRCPGHLLVQGARPQERIIWQCPVCADNGSISGWEGTAWDLSRYAENRAWRNGASSVELYVNDQEYELLRSVKRLTDRARRLLVRARDTKAGIYLSGTTSEMEELFGSVAAEANQEKQGPRRSHLDRLYNRLSSALE